VSQTTTTQTGKFTLQGVGSLEIDGGNAGNRFTIGRAPSGTSLTIKDGTGSDVIRVGDATHSLDGLSSLTVVGHTGTRVILDDSATQNPASSIDYDERTLTWTIESYQYNPSYQITGQGVTRSDAITDTVSTRQRGVTGTRVVSSSSSTTTLLGSFSLSGIGSLEIDGGATGNSFTLGALPTFAVNLNGGSGTNALTGPNADTSWTVSGANSGSLGTLNFAAMQNLVGGTGNDVFHFTAGGSLSGFLKGGGGSDRLDYAGLTTGLPASLLLSAPASATAGQPFSVTVSARDSAGNVVADFRGTVTIVADGGQVLVASYTFTAADKGSHTFPVTLTAARAHALSGSWTSLGAGQPSDTFKGSVVIAPAPVATLDLVSLGPVSAGKSATFTLTAHDAFGNVVKGFTGVVHFSNTGSAGPLTDYTFQAADQGVHTFSLPTTAAGQVVVSYTWMTADGAITGTGSGQLSVMALAAVPVLTGYTDTSSGAVITWAASQGAVSYEVSIQSRLGGTTQDVRVTGLSYSAVLHSGRATVRVRAINGLGDPSEWSQPLVIGEDN
jgi:hypothetical protein